jgi:AcrR family transcriptional regulator
VVDIEDRDERVVDAALVVFSRYGYAKTTMQDVASDAGMSRAALYLRFPGKEQLFRAGVRVAHARALDRVREVLSGPGDVVSRVDAALVTYFKGLQDQVSSSAHGRELLDAGQALTGDVVQEAHAALVGLLVSAVESASSAGHVRLSAVDASSADIVGLLLAVSEALQRASADPRAWLGHRALLFRLVRVALCGPDDPAVGLDPGHGCGADEEARS